MAKVNELMAIVRPRALLFVAIDGVAPRAKMNQQRARRYKSGHLHAIASARESSAPRYDTFQSCL